MGVMDFVRNGVREMMIARPDQFKQLIVQGIKSAMGITPFCQ